MDEDQSNDNGIGSLEGSIGENSMADVAAGLGSDIVSGADLQAIGLSAVGMLATAIGIATAANPAGSIVGFGGTAYGFGSSISSVIANAIAASLSSDPNVAAAQLAGFNGFEATSASFAGTDFGADGGAGSGHFVVAGAWELMPGVYWSNPYISHW